MSRVPSAFIAAERRSGTINAFSLYHLRRNVVWLVAKNYPAAASCGMATAYCSSISRRSSSPCAASTSASSLRAYRDALRGLPAAHRKRRVIQRSRAITASALETVIASPGGSGELRATSERSAPALVVTVATYNGRHLLEQMLPSVVAQRFRDFRVVVVDDASKDGTVEWLREAWPDAEVVALARNGGVTAAFNVCVRAARDARSSASSTTIWSSTLTASANC